MSPRTQIEVRALLALALVGTSIPVKSLDDAIEQLKKQASITGTPQKLLVEAEEPSMLLVGTTVTETVFETPDATLSVTAWVLLVDGSEKIKLPKAEPLVARAKSLAIHQKLEYIIVATAQGPHRVDLEDSAQTDIPHAPKSVTVQLPTKLPVEPQDAEPILDESVGIKPQPVIDAEPHDDSPVQHDLADEEPHLSESLGVAENSWDSWHEPELARDHDDHRSNTATGTAVFPRRALLVGLSSAAVLGVGSFAAYKLFSAKKTNQNMVPSPTPTEPVLTPPFAGVEPEPIRQFPMAYSDLAISADGQFLAVQISDSEVSVQKSNATGELPSSGTIDGEVLGFEGKLAPPVLPLSAQYGAGFILRILDSSGNLGASSKLIVWTPKNGAVTHKLPIGSQLTSRGGHSWISSTIPSTAPRTIQAITAEKLETFTAPSYGPALFGLLPKSVALWASIESDNTASILTCNARGKISATGILKRPAKSAVVAKWIAATADHALMLWKNSDEHVLVLHETKTGKITGKADFKFPDGTTADRLPSRNTTDGNVVILGSTWADLKTGKFGSPEGIDLNKVEAHPRPGGVELRTDAESTFRPDSGATFSVPNKGTVLAVTKEVVIVEESRLVSVYRKTTTEGK